jgi:F-type H+-transporting ATPase subunit b
MFELLAQAAGEAAHAEPTLAGLEAYQIVSIAMLVLIVVMIWKKVPALITGGLDARIAEIRKALDEARSLRTEAEALRAEYAARIASAEKDAEAMLAAARAEADAILAKAEADSEIIIARRQRMAEEKIAAAERAALAEVKARAVAAAAAASGLLIAKVHDEKADSRLADEVIASL